MQRKVLYVITKANWGGAQRYVFDLATSLSKGKFSAQGGPASGWEVGVAYGQPGLLAEKLTQAGVTTHELHSMQRDISANADWKSLTELVILFKKEKPDIVHLNSSKVGILGAFAARIAGVKKIIFTVHGWPFRESRNILARAIFWLASWMTALLSHKIICVSDFDLRQAKHMPFIGKKALRIYNGVEPVVFESGEKIRTAFPPGAKITGTIGELNKNKNQLALIEEARKNPNMYVAIVGEGELRSTLEQKIKEYNLSDRVKLLGFIPAKDALKGFDTFALPSIKEGLPYVLLEARQAGLPIVANRTGGVSEILDAKDLNEFTLDHMLEKTAELYRG